MLDYMRNNPGSSQAGPTQVVASAQSPDASQASPLTQADATQNASDPPQRILGRRTYNPSDPSPFDRRSSAPAAPASPDGSLTLNEAYLEYLKRLNAN